MKSKVFTCIACLLSSGLFSQQSLTNWTVSAEPQKVFIENKSQFDNCLSAEKRNGNSPANKILFATEKAGTQIFFTKTGLTYRLEKAALKKTDEKEMRERGMSHEEMEKEEREMNIETDLLIMEWENSSPNVEVVALSPVEHYYSYPLDNKKTEQAKAYQKLLYKNLYPNVDVEYIFHPQQGIEYSFILHPGADASQIKMKYSDVSKTYFDKNGNLHFTTIFGDIVDHAPLTFYSDNKDVKIDSRFTKQGKTVSFALGNYDYSKEVIIDPWTITPALPNSNKAFYIKADSNNNAYVYGGTHPFKLQKYNAAGVLQWTYNTPWDSISHWFGTLVVDKAGNSYITDGTGVTLCKINSAGGVVWSQNDFVTTMAVEYWAIDLNADQTELYIGGSRHFQFDFDFNAAVFKMNMDSGTVLNHVNVAHKAFTGTTAGISEVRSMCTAPDGNIYFLTLDSIGSATSAFNVTFKEASGYSFPYYLPYSTGVTGQGQNNIRVSSQYIYTTNGRTLEKRNISTGSVITSVVIPGGGAYYNGGVTLDDCGNVYAGSQTGVYKYNENLILLSSASTPDAVYDVTVNNNGEVLACGNGFATSINMSACSPYLSPAVAVNVTPSNATCTGICNGSANAVVTHGVPPYNFLWSNNATTSSISGLCAGTYGLTVTDSTGHSAIASTTISLTTFSFTDSVINTVCGGSSGVVGIISLTGIPPYSFLWSTGATSSVIFGLTAGVYSVTITDSAGCIVADTFAVFGTGNGNISISANSNTICANDSAQICAPSGYSLYHWSNGLTTTCISTSQTGSYSVTVTDNAYCTAASLPLQILVLPVPVVSVLLNGSTLSVSSPNSLVAYQWYLNDTAINGATSAAYSATLQGNYSVAVTGTNGCTALSSSVYYSPCTAYFVLFPDLVTAHNWWGINQATGTLPITYLWSWGDGNTSTGPFPTHLYSTPGNYDICLSIMDSNLCTSSYCDSSTYIFKTENMISVNIVSQLPTGITEDVIASGMYVFPNPAGNKLNISISGLQAERVRVYNASGQLVSDTSHPQDNHINISQLATGAYVAEVKVRRVTVRLRWVKM